MTRRKRREGGGSAQLDLPLVKREPASRMRQADPITVRIPEAIRLTGIGRSKHFELIASRDEEIAKKSSNYAHDFSACISAFVHSFDQPDISQSHFARCPVLRVRTCGLGKPIDLCGELASGVAGIDCCFWLV
jgi:hypothetical protein